jgi:tRNA(fMet)-specific endonuclease VapC
MIGRALLDTNIVIKVLQNDTSVLKKVCTFSEIYIPNIVVGELYFGAYKSTKVQDNIRKIEEFIIFNSVLDCNVSTSKIYGDIKNKLKLRGKPIPENDIWIASIAKQHNLKLITMDNHFTEVDSLDYFLK